MPQRVTMRRARSVTTWRSFSAPVVTCSGPKASSSATRPPSTVRRRRADMAVEAPGTNQALIQNVHTLRCCPHHHRLAGIESISLYQQLDQRRVTVVMAQQAYGTLRCTGINFIDKDDTGR